MTHPHIATTWQEHFLDQGFAELPESLGEQQARALYDIIFRSRPFDSALFLSADEWQKSGKSHAHTNPCPGRNFLESHQEHVSFVEMHPQLRAMLTATLGQEYRILTKKIVCRLPKRSLPDWVITLIGGKPANTLNAFIHPQYRDITYYLEDDLHQDVHAYPRLPERIKDYRLISLYVHLDEVAADNGPLYLLPRTHLFGSTPYQHAITRITPNQWRYDGERGQQMITRLKPIVGKPGHAVFWHTCLVHGARPVTRDTPRLVMRYMLGRSLQDSNSCLLDIANKTISGPLYPETDYNAGAHANPDGSWNLHDTDFTRYAS